MAQMMMNQSKDQPDPTKRVSQSIDSTLSPHSSPSTTPPSRPESVKDPHHRGGKLRFTWNKMEIFSGEAKKIYENQHNCSRVIHPYVFRRFANTSFGMGSDIHTFLNSVYMGMFFNDRREGGGWRARAFAPPQGWAWYDQEGCGDPLQYKSLLECYFPDVEARNCPEGETFVNVTVEPNMDQTLRLILVSIYKGKPPRLLERRAALTEALFSTVSPLVIAEAERQLRSVFPPDGIVPPNLITVHVRWGDKFNEMKLLEIQKYVDAVQELVDANKLSEVSVLLCTEDPEAVQAFRETMPKTWALYLEDFFKQYIQYRGNTTYNVAGHTSEKTKGKAGLWTIASALVAVEANYFVLTTRSNWSRLIDELRVGIVNPRCNGCTQKVDLQKSAG